MSRWGTERSSVQCGNYGKTDVLPVGSSACQSRRSAADHSPEIVPRKRS